MTRKKAFVLMDIKSGGVVCRAIWAQYFRSGDHDDGRARAHNWINNQFHAWAGYAYQQGWDLRIEEQDM